MPPKHFKFANLYTVDLRELVLQPRGLRGSSSSSLQAWRCWGGLYGAGETSHQAQLCGSSFLPVELPSVPAVAQTSGAGGQHHLEFDRDLCVAADFWSCHSSSASEPFSGLHVAACFAPRWVLSGQQHHVHPGDVVFGAPFHALQTVWAAFPGLPLSYHWTICPLSCFWPARLCWHGGDGMHSVFCRQRDQGRQSMLPPADSLSGNGQASVALLDQWLHGSVPEAESRSAADPPRWSAHHTVTGRCWRSGALLFQQLGWQPWRMHSLAFAVQTVVATLHWRWRCHSDSTGQADLSSGPHACKNQDNVFWTLEAASMAQSVWSTTRPKSAGRQQPGHWWHQPGRSVACCFCPACSPAERWWCRLGGRWVLLLLQTGYWTYLLWSLKWQMASHLKHRKQSRHLGIPTFHLHEVPVLHRPCECTELLLPQEWKSAETGVQDLCQFWTCPVLSGWLWG